MKLDETIPALLGLSIFGGLTGYLLRLCWLALSSRRWPSTTGRITDSRTVSADPNRTTPVPDTWNDSYGRTPRVRYEYEVDGRAYQGSCVRFGGWLNANRYDARATVAKYPDGKSVTVYYHSQKPALSTLEQRASGTLYILLAVGLFATGSIAGALLGWWK